MAQMARFSRLAFITVIFLVTAFAIPSASATDPPADLCSLLTAAEVSKTLGRSYEPPEKSVAPRPYTNTPEGTDCNYAAKGSKLWLRAYVDPSAAAATEMFAKLGEFYNPQTPVTDLGDEAYFDPQHGLHVRKGKVRFYLNLEDVDFSPKVEKQLKELAGRVAGRL
jgi:hypothetical protein